MKKVLKLLKDCNLLEKADEASLTLLGDTYEMYLNCRDDIEKNGITLKGTHNNIINPSATLQIKCVHTIMAILKDYGISTKSRKMMLNGSTDKDNSPINQFLEMMNETETDCN